MTHRIAGLRATLLAGAATLAIVPQALGADAKTTDAKIEALQQQVQQLNAELQDLKQQQVTEEQQKADQPDVQAAIVDLKRSTAAQYADIQAQAANSPKATIDNGRPTISSADGQFTASLRVLAQYDEAYFSQSARAALTNAPDLSSGSNFRRAQLGLQGKIFGDWSYFANFEFGSGGSSGNEGAGRIQQIYVEYDGFGPLAFRIGAYPPPAGLEDSTASSDTIFLERAASSDIIRNTAAGDARDATSVIYAGDDFFAALSLTGGKAADSNLYFDEQQALVGRVSDFVYSDSDSRIVLSGSSTWVFRGPDTTAGSGSARYINLQSLPEVTVDDNGTKLVGTGNLNAESVLEWGVEAGAQWQNLYSQAGYFGYDVNRRAAPVNQPDSYSFYGWYVEGTWVLTGESKSYNKQNAAFTPPKPAAPFSFDGSGWGAWELAARYSALDLNDDEGVLGSALPAGGIRGGQQRIWTLGVNWYPNSDIKFALDYQNIGISRIGTIPQIGTNAAIPNADVGQNINAVELRSQLSL